MLEQQQTISFSDYSSLYDLIIPKDTPPSARLLVVSANRIQLFLHFFFFISTLC